MKVSPNAISCAPPTLRAGSQISPAGQDCLDGLADGEQRLILREVPLERDSDRHSVGRSSRHGHHRGAHHCAGLRMADDSVEYGQVAAVQRTVSSKPSGGGRTGEVGKIAA